MSKRIILIISLVGALLASCSSTPEPSQAFRDSLVNAYQLDSGDQLRVVVFGQTDLSNTYSVDGGGKVAFPLIGAIQARGLTLRQFETQLSAQLGERYLRNPDVTVEVAEYRPFFILGEVQNPGQFPYVIGMTVQTAAAIAGGYTPRAQQRSAVINRQVTGRVISGEVAPNHPVRPGDTITISERFF